MGPANTAPAASRGAQGWSSSRRTSAPMRRQNQGRQNQDRTRPARLRCLHSKDISMALPKLRGLQGELAETLVAELSTLQPHPASVGRLLRLHPVETVEAVGVRACRGRAVPPVAERVQNGSAGGVIDPTPSVLCTCAGKQSRLGQTSAAGSPGRPFLRQLVLQSALSFGQPRTISRFGGARPIGHHLT